MTLKYSLITGLTVNLVLHLSPQKPQPSRLHFHDGFSWFRAGRYVTTITTCLDFNNGFGWFRDGRYVTAKLQLQDLGGVDMWLLQLQVCLLIMIMPPWQTREKGDYPSD